MLKDVEWSEDGTYSPQGPHTLHEFFTYGLTNSNRFDLQLGYFNSAAIRVLSASFATFIKKGGCMRMAINQIVSKKDKDAIIEGSKGGIDAPFDISNWESIKESLDEYGVHFFKCLAFLIQENRIKIQIIKPKETIGIAHTKTGIFADEEGTKVGFSGSANFTLGGLFNNIEKISIDLSTSSDSLVLNRISHQEKEFDAIMQKEDNSIQYLPAEELIEAIHSTYGDQEIEDLLQTEKELKKHKYFIDEVNSVAEEEDVCYYDSLPKFPYKEGPRPYQQEAFENWKNNGQKGLFAMATGTGKTITSLNCLLEIYKRNGYYKAIILVPTITLVNQWEQECLKFNFSNIIKVYSKNSSWRDEVDRIGFNEKYKTDKDKEESYVIISTYASYSRENVFAILNGFDKRRLLLIADECHNMASGSLVKRLKQIPYLRKIGLSATPERQFDEQGNTSLLKFFSSTEKYTYEYSMEEAIHNGVLCRYFYYPHIVELTSEEMSEYVQLSERIVKYFNYNSNSFDSVDERLKMLLLARKRIIHKAENKLITFKKIIRERFDKIGNLKYSLVYVPEGNLPDYIENGDYSDENIDDIDTDHLINLYSHAITEIDDKVTIRKFTAGQKDRKKILEDFASGKLQVLTSMKCLDEGVDVPRSELAIFCASTGNPRQFIQRRGRVLRIHPDKDFAILHDLVVIPEVSSTSKTYKMEQSLLKGELLRVKNFALLSENPSFSEIELRTVMDHYGLNLYNNNHI